MASDRPERARYARWHAAAEMLALVRRRPGITRAAAARELNLSSGSALEISRRLRDLGLLSDSPAAVRGPGRPSTVLQPHPHGPLVLAIELRHEDWRSASPHGAARSRARADRGDVVGARCWDARGRAPRPGCRR